MNHGSFNPHSHNLYSEANKAEFLVLLDHGERIRRKGNQKSARAQNKMTDDEKVGLTWLSKKDDLPSLLCCVDKAGFHKNVIICYVR